MFKAEELQLGAVKYAHSRPLLLQLEAGVGHAVSLRVVVVPAIVVVLVVVT